VSVIFSLNEAAKMYDLKDLPGIFLFSNIHSPILKKTKNVSLKNSGHLNTKEIKLKRKLT